MWETYPIEDVGITLHPAQWLETKQIVFNTVKQCLTLALLLTYADYTKPFRVYMEEVYKA